MNNTSEFMPMIFKPQCIYHNERKEEKLSPQPKKECMSLPKVKVMLLVFLIRKPLYLVRW